MVKLSDKPEKFIDVTRKPSEVDMVTSGPSEAMPPYGPTLYINDVELPFTSQDVGKDFEAEIKFRLKSHSVNTADKSGKKSSYDLEILGIKIGE